MAQAYCAQRPFFALAALILGVSLFVAVDAPAQDSRPAATPLLRETPATLENAANGKRLLDYLGLTLSGEQKAFLNTHKFLLVPQSALKKTLPPPPCAYSWDDMLTMSDAVGGDPDEHYRKPENARLITPDAVLHAFHKLFDNTLDHVETTELARQLYMFLLSAQRAALEERRAAKPELAARLERVAAQLTVPLILLESAPWSPLKGQEKPVPNAPAALEAEKITALARLDALAADFQPETVQAMRQELEHIFASRSVAVSPLFGVYAASPDQGGYTAEMDYTQFTPRGHYAKNGRSRAYFRAMAFLGKAQWPLDREPGLGDALILTLIMDRPGPGGRPALDAWNRLYQSTTLFAGKPDDPGHEEITRWIGWTFGERRLSLEDALDPAVHALLAAKLSRTDGPRVRGLGAHSGLRLLGQRFTQDGWMLSRLFGERPWAQPSVLFVAAALGDKTARAFALEHLKRTTPPGKERDVELLVAELDAMAAEVAKWPLGRWEESLASSWLAALKALGGERGAAHPAYMRSAPFRTKQLQTMFGSYAELKHDTILYAKQPEAECGEGSDTPPPPVPKGFVEPGEAFWQAMTVLAAKAREGFDLPQWRRFEDDVRFLAGVARKESASQPVSKEEYERLRTLRLDAHARPFDPELVPEEGDTWTALVADVFTDHPKGTVLYEATARHYLMLALVGNENAPRLVAGVAFNHYEFNGPLDRRMTDQDWQATVYKGQGELPQKNFWYSGLVPGEK